MLQLNALYEETKLKFLKLKEEDRELEKEIASREAVAEQQVQEQRQLETEIEKVWYEECGTDVVYGGRM